MRSLTRLQQKPSELSPSSCSYVRLRLAARPFDDVPSVFSCLAQMVFAAFVDRFSCVSRSLVQMFFVVTPKLVTPAIFALILLLGAACTQPLDLDAILFNCGDGLVEGSEACDDRNRVNLDGCSATCQLEVGYSCRTGANGASVCSPECGDARRLSSEACDDGNLNTGDGCSNTCTIEPGWACGPGTPSICNGICGDGQMLGAEACDDANAVSGDGCSARCVLEDGFDCNVQVSPTSCGNICGDGLRVLGEACDDGNNNADDGCLNCVVENGWTCTGAEGALSTCFLCGDGSVEASIEVCDDGNQAPNDGCSPVCAVEMGWMCDGASPTMCAPICGDGLTRGTEGCDDRNMSTEDGCDLNCAVEEGFVCNNTSVPSVCTAQWRTQTLQVELQPNNGNVFTGTEILVFGGGQIDFQAIGTGQRFDLMTEMWSNLPVAGAPAGRLLHSAIWTGQEMLVFGGFDPLMVLNNGGAFNPTNGAWRLISDPISMTGRASHTAVWTGTLMLVYGGETTNIVLDDGVRYDPSADTWTAMAASGQTRTRHTAVWTGTEMFIHGGTTNVDGVPMTLDAPMAYDPSTDMWRALASSPLQPRSGHRSLWTGTEVIIFGGSAGNGAALGDGARYNPTTDTWTFLPNLNAPSARAFPAIVQGGDDIFVVGGAEDNTVGARWRISDNMWRRITDTLAPGGLGAPIGIWTGQELFVVSGGVSGFYRPPVVPQQ